MTLRTLLRTSICLICFVYLTSCKEDRPDHILSEAEMTQIVLEVYLGEGKISGLNVKRDSSLAIFEVYEKHIFSKFGVARDQYKQSLSYYYEHPDKLEKIYEGVLDSLNIKEQRLKELEKEKMEKKYNSEGAKGGKADEKGKEIKRELKDGTVPR